MCRLLSIYTTCFPVACAGQIALKPQFLQRSFGVARYVGPAVTGAISINLSCAPASCSSVNSAWSLSAIVLLVTLGYTSDAPPGRYVLPA